MTEITSSDVQATIAKLTPKGRQLMTAVGRQEVSFFDDGIVEGSGIWGECLASETGLGSGVLNRTRDLGLWITSDQGWTGSTDSGMCWALTALGAAVANELAMTTLSFSQSPVLTTKVGKKWTYVYSDGELIAEIRSDRNVLAVLQAI